MTEAEVLTPSVWIVWVVIGITAGFMTGRLLPERAPLWVTIVVGIAAACVGGWIFTRIFGCSDTDFYLSLVSSALLSGIALWITAVVGRLILRS